MQTLQRELPKSLAQKVATQLREAIMQGKFSLGALIPEERLAQSFGVSRTPVREAINLLQLEGLVVVRPQVGSFVFSPSPTDLQAIFDFRVLLEPQAARLSYQNNREKAVEEMDYAIAQMDSALKNQDLQAYGMADTLFHEILFTHCGNSYLQQASQLVTGRVAALRNNLTYPVLDRDPYSFEEHKDLAQLFTAGDLDAFEVKMTHHIRRGFHSCQQIFQKVTDFRRAV